MSATTIESFREGYIAGVRAQQAWNQRHGENLLTAGGQWIRCVRLEQPQRPSEASEPQRPSEASEPFEAQRPQRPSEA